MTLPLATGSNSSFISAIRNLVCPLCGASMMAFRCLGFCRRDWRLEWTYAISSGANAEAGVSVEMHNNPLV